jgi:hypothetical protein
VAQRRPGTTRAPSVRIAPRDRPELFVMEYETAPVDQAWLAELDSRYDAEYEEAKAARDTAKARREKALRDDLKAQDAPQPELEAATSGRRRNVPSGRRRRGRSGNGRRSRAAPVSAVSAVQPTAPASRSLTLPGRGKGIPRPTLRSTPWLCRLIPS